MIREVGGSKLFVYDIVSLAREFLHDLGVIVVLVGCFLRRRRDDVWSTGFIDKDRVHLIHDGVMKITLGKLGHI